MKKALSIIMAVVILFFAVPMSGSPQLDFSAITARAADDSQPLSWVKNDDNTITITACDTSYSGTLIIPQTIEDMPVSAIGDGAMTDCSLLTEIVIPETVVSIGSPICHRCSSLQKITVDQNNNNFSSDENGILYNKDKSVLYKCPPSNGITEFTVPDTVTEIYNRAFQYHSTLKDIIILDTVKTIENRAFFGCSMLSAVSLPSGLKKIEDSTFEKCSSLSKIDLSGVAELGNQSFMDCTSLKEIVIPDSIKYIGSTVFYNCTSLEKVILSKSLTAIHRYDFYGCTSLKEVVMPEWVKIEQSAFENCSSLKSIDLTNAYEVGIYAFKGCSSLESVVLNDNITKISVGTFYECFSLKSVTLPDGLKEIDDNAFTRCTSLTSIKIPEDVNLICQYAFSGCTGLKEITIPDSVTKLGRGALEGCTDLKSVKLSKKLSLIDAITFYKCSSLISIDIPPSVKSIGDSAFYSCFNLRNIILHSETSIFNSAFKLPGSGVDKLTIIIDGDAPQTKELVKQYGINCVDVDYDHGEKVVSFNGKTTVYAGADYSYITNCIMERPEAEYLYFDKLIFDGVKNDVIISDEMTFVEPDAENLTFNHLYVNMKMITEDGDKKITFEKMLDEFEKGNYDAFKLVVKSDEGEHEQSAVEKFIGRILTDALNAMSRVINFFARLFKRR